MKVAQINPANVSISLIYCLFGVLAFVVLKLVARYFLKNGGESLQVGKGKVQHEDLERVNFSKIFIKTYMMKSTLIGSMINKDKRYLLRQILVMSSIGVCCFNINSYILWPWTVGFGVFLATFAISQILIPLIMESKKNKVKVQQSQWSSRKNSTSVIDSNSIQIQHTQLQLSVSVQRQLCLNSINVNVRSQRSGQSEKKSQASHIDKQLTLKQKVNLTLILIMAVIAQILFCQCILTLSLSVSNSGVLNLISFGLSLVIDQFAARIGFGLLGYVVCFVLHKTQKVNFFQNYLFVTYCHEYLTEELKKVHTERLIQQMQNKITKINNPQIHPDVSNKDKFSEHNEENLHQISTQMKIILPCVFQEVFQEVPVANSQVLPVGQALLQEPQSQQQGNEQTIQEVENDGQSIKQQTSQVKSETQVHQGIQPTVQQISEIHIQNQQNQIDTKSQTNYFELFQHDLQVFDQSKAYEIMKIVPVKKLKKKYHQSQPKFKSDPLLYFPYEEHKLSHKVSFQRQFKENSQFQPSFSRDRSTIGNNFLSTIEIVDCTEDSIIRQEPEINLVLQQKNMNIKHLTINQKPIVPPTSRPGYSEKKKEERRNENIKSSKKVSPYFVNLSSQAVKPTKTKKIQVSKNNKQNANQTNKSFMTSQVINLSRMTQKDLFNMAIINNQNSTIIN